MENIEEAIISKLEERYAGEPELKNSIELAKNIFSWNRDGGKELVEEEIKTSARNIEKSISDVVKEIKRIVLSVD
ncbi:MAG TPA: hypothetical protein VJI12_00895 [archaeon]|nr:hypothetical protein [archaeon]